MYSPAVLHTWNDYRGNFSYRDEYDFRPPDFRRADESRTHPCTKNPQGNRSTYERRVGRFGSKPARGVYLHKIPTDEEGKPSIPTDEEGKGAQPDEEGCASFPDEKGGIEGLPDEKGGILCRYTTRRVYSQSSRPRSDRIGESK